MIGIDEAIEKAETLVKSVNANVAVIEDATRIDWLTTHVTHKNNFPANLASVEHYGIVIKRKSGRELIAFLLKNNAKQVNVKKRKPREFTIFMEISKKKQL